MKMEKSYIIYFLFALGFTFLLGLFLDRFIITGKAVDSLTDSKNYTWTTAICNADRECIDVLIACENGRVKEITPLSDLRIFNSSWVDSRTELELCR